MTLMLDGKMVAAGLRQDIALRVKSIHESGRIPSLAVVRVGDNPASAIYVAAKHKAAQEVGIHSIDYVLPLEDWSAKLLQLIHELNQNESVHGILLQLPLPQHVDPFPYIQAIDPLKDVDGLGALNAGLLALGRPQLIPCTPRGCLSLLHHYQIPIAGKHVVVVGRSVLVGKPLAQLMLQQQATVTTIHSQTSHPEVIARTADILIVAAGVPKLVNRAWCHEGSVIIDVGITRQDDGICGDVDFDHVYGYVKALSPVPGGVGPMTVTSLLENTLQCYELQAKSLAS